VVATDLVALLPLILISVTTVVVMLAIAFQRNHLLTVWLTLIGLAVSFASLWVVASLTPRPITTLLVLDKYALFYMGMIFAATIAVVILCYGYFEQREGEPEEAYVLLLVAALGSAVLVASNHFASFFLGLEILSVALYALNAYLHTRKRPLEAGIKYLILAASSAAFLLFGMALIYAQLGTMEFGRMADLFAGNTKLNDAMLLAGIALIITGFGFKLAIVPFHLWTPDIYEGAPAPVTAFVATVSKGGVFALLLRYFYRSGAHQFGSVFLVFSIVAIASMIAGNLLALLQNNVKRILAYSSIAHMGYLLVAFQAGGSMAAEAVTFYLVAYFITTLGAFGVVTIMSTSERDADNLGDYRGLFWRRPGLAILFSTMLFSLAGIPLTAGFVGKFYIVAAGAAAAIWTLVFVLVITSVFGLFYYLRSIVTLFADVPETTEAGASSLQSLSLGGNSLLVVLAVLLVLLGVYPVPLLNWIRTVVTSLM
jgi:NADH-quinone oxidoreductase subunit N